MSLPVRPRPAHALTTHTVVVLTLAAALAANAVGQLVGLVPAGSVGVLAAVAAAALLVGAALLLAPRLVRGR